MFVFTWWLLGMGGCVPCWGSLYRDSSQVGTMVRVPRHCLVDLGCVSLMTRALAISSLVS